MKSKLFYFVFAIVVTCATVYGESAVQGFDRFFSFRSVSENGDVYKVQRRAEAYCDGTIVVHERSRLLYEACDACDRSDADSCDRGWNYSEPRTYASCDADAGSCDRQIPPRGSRQRRPLFR